MRAETQPPSKLDDIGYRGDAELFRVLRQIGVKPHEANEMELWEIGVILGADLPQEPGIDPELWEREKDTLAERAQKVREAKQEPAEVEMPEPEEPIDITAMVQKQMGIRTK